MIRVRAGPAEGVRAAFALQTTGGVRPCPLRREQEQEGGPASGQIGNDRWRVVSRSVRFDREHYTPRRALP